MKKICLLFMLVGIMAVIGACSSEDPTDDTSVNSVDSSTDDLTDDTSDELDADNGESDSSIYTEEELESDPKAPSSNPNDYNDDGEYVPENGVSDNPADYNANGEYKPVEDMTQEEIEKELESMIGDSINQ
ncbi:hypothetical protein [Bacillus inaquosorum]|uniref:Lipoprotein n=1 Tax=Bacillus inaquosorum TaxID=483913 RepID=A0A9Q4ESB0_9BACI|nr:hypothetical protein [Bacillus inaquosorum]MCY9230057.1 hypothetical protein [Bacillus inaquosorum]